MSTKTIDTDQRRIVERIDTGRPEIKLQVVTWHNRERKTIETRVGRIEITDVGYREKMDIGRKDPAPVEFGRTTVPRYNVKHLTAAHGRAMSAVASTECFGRLINWAERA